MTIHEKWLVEDFICDDVGSAALLIRGIGERVGKHHPQTIEGFRHAVDGDWPLHLEVERAKVIKSTDMIEMMVGIDHGIQTVNPRSETLLTKIRCGVKDDACIVKLHPDGWPESLIPGVG